MARACQLELNRVLYFIPVKSLTPDLLFTLEAFRSHLYHRSSSKGPNPAVVWAAPWAVGMHTGATVNCFFLYLQYICLSRSAPRHGRALCTWREEVLEQPALLTAEDLCLHIMQSFTQMDYGCPGNGRKLDQMTSICQILFSPLWLKPNELMPRSFIVGKVRFADQEVKPSLTTGMTLSTLCNELKSVWTTSIPDYYKN